jgi:transposase
VLQDTTRRLLWTLNRGSRFEFWRHTVDQSSELALRPSSRRSPAARGTSTSVGRWKQQFLEAGKLGLAAGVPSRPSSREEALAAEVAELITALGEAHVELRAWKKSAEGRLAPSRTSR